MSDPRSLRQTSLGLILAGAVLAGLGDGVRAAAGTGEANWTFFLDVVGLLFALAGAVLEARSADLMFTFAPAETRGRALIRTIAAIPTILVTCVSLGAIDQPVLRGVAGAIVMFGIGGTDPKEKRRRLVAPRSCWNALCYSFLALLHIHGPSQRTRVTIG
jgi:hypothetical protein